MVYWALSPADYAEYFHKTMQYLRTPICIDFSREYHKFLFNWEELGGKIVDYTEDGISKPGSQYNNYAFKFSVDAGETKYLRIPITRGNQCEVCLLRLYLTGDVKATLIGGWMYTNPVCNIRNTWTTLVGRSSAEGVFIKFEATSGGNVYINNISLYSLTRFLSEITEYASTPDQSLDGSTTHTYYISFMTRDIGYRVLSLGIAGDGTNTCDVEIYLKTKLGEKKIGDASRSSSSIGWYFFAVPCYLLNYSYILFSYVKLVVSGYGTFYRYTFTNYNLDRIYPRYVGAYSETKFETSSTAVTHTLFEDSGMASYFKDLTADITIASGGGSVVLKINGQTVGTYTSSTTVDLSWFTEPIYQITADITGDGTNASSVTISGQRFEYAYVLSR